MSRPTPPLSIRRASLPSGQQASIIMSPSVQDRSNAYSSFAGPEAAPMVSPRTRWRSVSNVVMDKWGTVSRAVADSKLAPGGQAAAHPPTVPESDDGAGSPRADSPLLAAGTSSTALLHDETYTDEDHHPESDIAKGAVCLDRGLHSRRERANLTTLEDVRWYWLFHSKRWFMMYVFACTIHIVSSVFESPCSFCFYGDNTKTGGTSQFVVVLIIDLLCMLTYAVDLALCRRLYGKKFFKLAWHPARAVLLFLMAVDTIAFLSSGLNTPRLSRMVRPLMLLCRLRNVRKMASGLVATVYQISGIFVVINFTCVIFGLFGFLLLSHEHFGNTQFSTVSSAIYTMWVVNCSMGTVVALFERSQQHQVIIFYMLVYQLLLSLLLYKLVIAVAYSSYRNITREQMLRSLQKRDMAMRDLFRILEEKDKLPDRVTKAAWRRVAMYPHRGRPLKAEECEILWSVAVGEDYTSADMSKFVQLCSIMDTHVERSVRPPPKSALGWRIFRAQKALQGMLRRRWTVGLYEIHFPPVLYMLFVVLSLVQLSTVANPRSVNNHMWGIVGTVVLGFFLVEFLVVQVWVRTFRRAAASPVAWLSAIANAAGVLQAVFLGFFPNVADNNSRTMDDLLHACLCIQSLRLVVVVMFLPSGRRLYATMDRVLSAIAALLMIYFSILYIFAVVGTALYHNHLTPFNTALSHTKWWSLRYALDFTTLWDALIALAETSVLPNWTTVMDAGVKSGLHPAISYTFFFAFRTIVSMLFVPMLVGWIIDMFVTHFKDNTLKDMSSWPTMVRHVEETRAYGNQVAGVFMTGDGANVLTLPKDSTSNAELGMPVIGSQPEPPVEVSVKLRLRRRALDTQVLALDKATRVGGAIQRLEDEIQGLRGELTWKSARMTEMTRTQLRQAALVKRLESEVTRLKRQLGERPSVDGDCAHHHRHSYDADSPGMRRPLLE